MYYITFEDMYTLQFHSTHAYNDQDNPSTTFTEFSGSSEFRQISSPITDSFYAATTPVIDEWDHDATLIRGENPRMSGNMKRLHDGMDYSTYGLVRTRHR
jgi:hypothetical protein